MKRIQLTANKRTLTGRKVSTLRQKDIVPANIYGKGLPSFAIEVPLETLSRAYQEAGSTGLVDLLVDGETKPVLFKDMQLHPVSGKIVHVDFYQVNLKQKVHAQVPLEFVGTSPAVSNNVGVLLHLTDDVEVEALPTDLPENIQVDVSHLAEIGHVILVSNLKPPQGVTVVTAPETEVAKIGELVVTVEEEPVAPPPAEGEAAPEGATPEGSPSSKEEKPAAEPEKKSDGK